MSRGELAERANLTQGWLEKIEAGEVSARWGDLRGIAYALRIALPDLIREGEAREPG